MEEKRIYSLNLISYLKSRGFEEVDVRKDEENKVYYIFQEDESIAEAIRSYKEDLMLGRFIRTFRDVKKKVKSM